MSALLAWMLHQQMEDTSRKSRASVSTTDNEPCPHGYVEGDHHWYGCMGVDPFAPAGESSKSRESEES